MESGETHKQQQQHGDQCGADSDAGADDAAGPYELAAGLASLVRRPPVFDKMESLVREMQDPENGVPVRSQKLFLTSIPSAFMGYDMIEWLMERLNIEDSVEAIHIANLLCQHGYFFPVGECNKTLAVKDDSSLYRFQTPYYWPSQNHNPENGEYLIYLYKRSLRNKQKHGLEDYELEALNRLKKQMAHKWEFIVMQAEEQVRLAKDRKKGDKIVIDSQERAYWRAYRPPPSCLNCLEQPPYPIHSSSALSKGAGGGGASSAPAQASSAAGPSASSAANADEPAASRQGAPRRWRNVDELRAEVAFLRGQLVRARIKVSVAGETLQHHGSTYADYDPFISPPQPSNPWHTDDPTYWILNAPLVDVPTEKRAKKWAISIEDLLSDQTGLQELTNYLRKEYSHENIRFWLATNQLRSGSASRLQQRVREIYEEFLAPGAPCEINIDGRTMDQVQNEMRCPSRFAFDKAAEHVYNLLLKKDCYPRFVRSEHYKQLLANALQPSHKKRFFSFGATGKKKSIVAATAMGAAGGGGGGAFGHPAALACGPPAARRRGSFGERSLSGSPPDHAGAQQQQQQQQQQPLAVPTSSLLLASTSASTAAASAGLSAAAGSPSSCSTTAKSPGDECDAPYRGDMPGPRSSSAAAPTSAAPPSATPPSAHLQSNASESSPVPVPAPRRSSVGDVCPWEVAGEPGAAPRAGAEASASLSCSAESHHPSAELDVCPWESSSAVVGRRTPVAARRTSSAVERSAAPDDAAAVCPWESQELAPEVSPKRPPHATPPSFVRHADNQTPNSSSDVSVSVSNPSKSPVSSTSSGRQRIASSTCPAAPAPGEHQQQQPVEKSSAKISDICPWEDEESCKVDKPFVKTYATLGYL